MMLLVSKGLDTPNIDKFTWMVTAAVDRGVEGKIFKATGMLTAQIMSPKTTIITEVIVVATNNYQGFQIKVSSQVN